jgi:hypothetical protein
MIRRRQKTVTVVIAFALWAAVTTGGLALLVDYGATPGATRPAPALWPRDSTLPAPAHRPTLVLFLHPQCPCSRATVAELAGIMARVEGKVVATVLILQPDQTAGAWARTQLVRSVAAIPHVAVRSDLKGAEAAVFHATTSGEAYVYDARGRLRFHGGITGARGHLGDNAGRRAVQSLVLCGAGEVATTAAFGCPLHLATSARPTTVFPP